MCFIYSIAVVGVGPTGYGAHVALEGKYAQINALCPPQWRLQEPLSSYQTSASSAFNRESCVSGLYFLFLLIVSQVKKKKSLSIILILKEE